MKIKEIKKQFEILIKSDIIPLINVEQLVRRHPNYPLISKIKLSPNNISLSEDQIDCLNDGESVKINCDIPGQYTKTQKDGNLSAPNSFFTLTIIELEIVIEGEKLKIFNCNSIASLNQY